MWGEEAGKVPNYTSYVVPVRNGLTLASIDYAGHSFQIGAAKGLEDLIFGRWGSLAYLKYVNILW